MIKVQVIDNIYSRYMAIKVINYFSYTIFIFVYWIYRKFILKTKILWNKNKNYLK